jgi:hypothetical protein
VKNFFALVLLALVIVSSVEAKDFKHNTSLSDLTTLIGEGDRDSAIAPSEVDWNLILSSDQVNNKESRNFTSSTSSTASTLEDMYKKARNVGEADSVLPGLSTDQTVSPRSEINYRLEADASRNLLNGEKKVAQYTYTYDSEHDSKNSGFLLSNKDMLNKDAALIDSIYKKEAYNEKTYEDPILSLSAESETKKGLKLLYDELTTDTRDTASASRQIYASGIALETINNAPIWTRSLVDADLGILTQDTKDSEGTSQILNSLILGNESIDYSKTGVLLSYDRTHKDRLSYKNYAVIIGINKYNDRMSLHTSVNDADSISSILKTCGYEVIELTDATIEKPTKHNILDGALAEISLKQDQGNIIIYFSGHGDKDSSGNFYLVPQDAKGDPSSYISQEEFKKRTRDFRNLAVIIDACNSGGFENAITANQIIMASSLENQPSNEDWIGSYSIFTKNLCSALKEAEKSKNILLETCFYRAREATIRWSQDHLLTQTPILIDKRNKPFYLI